LLQKALRVASILCGWLIQCWVSRRLSVRDTDVVSYQVTVANSEASLTAVVRERVPFSELSRFVPAACGEVWSYARVAGLPKPGRHVALYLDEVTRSLVFLQREGPAGGLTPNTKRETPNFKWLGASRGRFCCAKRLTVWRLYLDV
jgi:hypothetical protein